MKLIAALLIGSAALPLQDSERDTYGSFQRRWLAPGPQTQRVWALSLSSRTSLIFLILAALPIQAGKINVTNTAALSTIIINTIEIKDHWKAAKRAGGAVKRVARKIVRH
jgi:hypothetical protein